MQRVEFPDHGRNQIGFRQAPGTGRFFRVLSRFFGQPAAQGTDATSLFSHAAQRGQKGNGVQRVQPFVERRLKVRLPEEASVLKARPQDPLPTFLDHRKVFRTDVQDRQKVRQKLTLPVFDPETLLVGLHTGQQHLPGQFKEGRLNIAKQGHGAFHKPLHFIKQTIHPDNPSLRSLGQPVAFFHDVAPPVGRLQLDSALLRDGGNVVARRTEGKGAGAKDTVPLRDPPRNDSGDLKGHHGVVEQGHDPADGTGIGEISAAPAHPLGERQGGDDRGAQRSQHIYGRHAAGLFHASEVVSLFRLSGRQGGHIHPERTGEAFRRLGGVAACVKGDAGRGTHHDFFLGGLHVIQPFDNDDGATRGSAGVQTGDAIARFFQAQRETLGQFLFKSGQKTGGEFFRADFKNKGGH